MDKVLLEMKNIKNRAAYPVQNSYYQFWMVSNINLPEYLTGTSGWRKREVWVWIRPHFCIADGRHYGATIRRKIKISHRAKATAVNRFLKYYYPVILVLLSLLISVLNLY